MPTLFELLDDRRRRRRAEIDNRIAGALEQGGGAVDKLTALREASRIEKKEDERQGFEDTREAERFSSGEEWRRRIDERAAAAARAQEERAIEGQRMLREKNAREARERQVADAVAAGLGPSDIKALGLEGPDVLAALEGRKRAEEERARATLKSDEEAKRQVEKDALEKAEREERVRASQQGTALGWTKEKREREEAKTKAELEGQRIAAAKDAAAAPKPIGAADQDDLNLGAEGLALLQEVRDEAKGMDTGRTFGLRALAAEAVGRPNMGRFANKVGRLRQIVARFYEGGKLAEGDAKRYEQILANPGSQGEELFEATLKDMELELTRLMARKAAALQESGYRVPSSLTPKAAAPKPEDF